MARQLQPVQEQLPKEFGFKTVKLLKNHTLGIGSYGSVCKVMCDDLLCAAKIIHPTLIDPSTHQKISPQREHRLPIRRFERECAFLRDIRHPNIVQYLGLYQDPETGLPVLLMELMDESLTHFLETAAEPVPYHIQITICVDVAQALSFLHSNGIIHRDLSSNNILLIGKSRAKLTDFGMAKLVEANQFISHVSNTLCPGTDAYMPPEAVDKNAVYTEKGDIFSFGVNIIQILTRKFPDPGDRFKIVLLHTDHPQFPAGRVDVRASEVERRNNHISMIDTTHPLLSIALDCLNDQEGKRPSSGELCQRLATLRNKPECSASERECQDEEFVQQSSSVMKDHQILELKEQLQQQTQSSQQAVVDREQEIQRLRHDVANMISAKDQEIQQLEATLRDILGTKQQISHPLAEDEETVMTRNEHVHHRPLVQPEHSPVRSATQTLKSSTEEKMKLNTRYGEKAPIKIIRHTNGVVNGNVVYFKLGSTKMLLAFNSITDAWSRLPDCVAELTTLAVVKDLLTTVGGKRTNHLFSLKEEETQQYWTEVFPPMLTERHNVTAVCTDTALIVAGGEKYGIIHNNTLDTVEIMNTVTQQWSAAANLPYPLYRASATVSGGYLYMLGGWSSGTNATNSVFRCSVSNLSTLPLNQWSKVANAPCCRSTCTTMKGQLLSVGGWSIQKGKISTDILMYDQANNSWESIGNLSTPREHCFAVVLPDDRLMVVGGNCMWPSALSDTVEFATCVRV